MITEQRQRRRAGLRALVISTTVAQQIAVLLAVSQGLFDELPLDKIAEAQTMIRGKVAEKLPKLCQKIEQGEGLSEGDRRALLKVTKSNIFD